MDPPDKSTSSRYVPRPRRGGVGGGGGVGGMPGPASSLGEMEGPGWERGAVASFDPCCCCCCCCCSCCGLPADARRRSPESSQAMMTLEHKMMNGPCAAAGWEGA